MSVVMSVATMVKVLTSLGWVSIFAIDLNVINVDMATPLHNAILGVLILVSLALWKAMDNRGDGKGRTYAEGVVDGMKLTTANPDVPAPRQGPDAKILYLRTGTNADPCIQRAPKAAGTRSSS